jgi:hypothetical protein
VATTGCYVENKNDEASHRLPRSSQWQVKSGCPTHRQPAMVLRRYFLVLSR